MKSSITEKEKKPTKLLGQVEHNVIKLRGNKLIIRILQKHKIVKIEDITLKVIEKQANTS